NAAKTREDLDAGADLCDGGRADEDEAARAGVVHGLEAVELGAVGVAVDGDVEPAEAVLLRRHRARHEDEAGAGAEDRPAGRGERLERRLEAAAGDEAELRRALAAGEDEPVEIVEVGGGADEARGQPGGLERLGVRVEAALEGEDTDDDGQNLPLRA